MWCPDCCMGPPHQPFIGWRPGRSGPRRSPGFVDDRGHGKGHRFCGRGAAVCFWPSGHVRGRASVMVRSKVLFRRPIKAAFLVGAIALINVAVVGCSGNGANGGPPTSTTVPPRLATTTAVAPTTSSATAPGTSRVVATTPPTTATPTVDDAAQEILAVENAYRASVEAVAQASANPPNPTSPSLPATMDGAVLEQFRRRIAEHLAAGRAVRPGPSGGSTISIRQTTVSGDSARITVCVIDDAVVYDVATGGVLDETQLAALFAAELARGSNVWKVTGLQRLSVLEGATQCDEP